MKTILQFTFLLTLLITSMCHALPNTQFPLPEDLRDENGNRIMNEDPDGDALQRKIFNGLAANSQFGNSVSSAGDVNGDGYDDIVVGATGYNSFTGRAYIYFGGINMNAVADVTFTGVATGNFFGYSVSSAGDVNSDGYSDVIIGAYGFNSNMGRAYIYFGGAVMNNTVDVTLTGEAAGNFFGFSVAQAGDVNSDGYSDVIIGAIGHNSSTGSAYIFHGGASMNTTEDITMTGEAINNAFGNSVSSAGDVNADGFSDVIIGANGYSTSTGRAYVYLGGVLMDNTADVVMTGEAANNNFGASVSSAGDVNGDGYSDVIAGAYGIDGFRGKAYVYYGGNIMDGTEDATFYGESVTNFFGAAVSSAGDVNGDGFSDIVVGAYGFNSNTGKIYVYFGGESPDTTSDISMIGEETDNYFGNSVALAGDINGDGYTEVLSGAKGYNSYTGRAYYYDYFMSGEIIPQFTITNEFAFENFGYSVSTAGDVNGDGYPDVIIGLYTYAGSTGRAQIYFGGPSIDNTPDVIMTGEAVSNSFGVSVASAGDVNGDGYSDVVVGAEGFNSSNGRSYIYYGGSTMNNTADVIMTGVSTFEFGSSVASAGDVNGDGYADVIVGADGYFNVRGKAFIYLGGVSMDNSADVTMLGDSLYSYIGNSVSSAGDVNGDGYSDVIVGNSSFNSYYRHGEAYIFFGGVSMNSTKDVTLLGESPDNNFGSSVSSADINNDGYSDLIIGANGYNAGAGRVYIFYGGASMDNWADVIINGEYNSNFGTSVSTAGDMNGDGYPDLIVGAPQYGAGNGRAYIFFGGIFMDNQTDITLSGEATGNFGFSVSVTGDLNGDGFSDVISGANAYGVYSGRAYIYTGSAISAKPILLHAKDVPNDQGGFVDLKWARSSFDINGNDLITHYIVERSLPPSGGNFAWVNIASIPATKNSFYSYLSSTPFDSTANSSGTFFFRITAETNSPSQYWRSTILSGRSLDNISPPVVSPFNAFTESVNVRLTWNRNTAPDLLNYILFRSTSPSIDPYTEIPLTNLNDSTYLDTTPLGGLYFYFIVAQDIHNNYSPVAVTQAPLNVKNLFLFGAIQGLYNYVSNTMIYDTVTVYLRSATSPFAKIDSSKKELYGPGTGQVFTFINAQNNVPYYVEVKHRNAIETWSADPVTFVSDNASIAFSVDAIYAYGNNQILVDTDPYNVFAFYSGDVNQDGVIDASDLALIDNDAANFNTGYLSTDLNGDEIIDGSDAVLADNNAANFVSAVLP